jgi:uncharacterized protein YwbE
MLKPGLSVKVKVEEELQSIKLLVDDILIVALGKLTNSSSHPIGAKTSLFLSVILHGIAPLAS